MAHKIYLFLLVIFSSSTIVAQFNVRGKVTDNNNEPLIGVNIQEKGSLVGTVSDLDGRYELSLSKKDAIVIFSYVGYTTIEVNADGKAEVNAVMNPGIELGGVQIVGSRNYNRSSTESAVPVDVMDINALSAKSGRVEINQILQYAAPSFNSTKQSGSDGADHIDPASLRGLGPDQTLVLINGKRRHQSSLVNVFGTRGRGSTGTDLNAIPASAIKRIEILRDGASAQYGSDAIAGVINIVLKDEYGLTGGLNYGAYSTKVGGSYMQDIFDTQDGWETTVYNVNGKNRLDGKEKSFDGNTLRANLNYGMKLTNKGGYLNVTAEYLDKARTLRPGYEWRQGYGSAAVGQSQFMLNGMVPIGSKSEVYAFGGYGNRATDAYAYTRSAAGEEGDDRTVAKIYPNGFTPRITSDINDLSGVIGIRHTTNSGWKLDLSQNYGKNDFHYFIKGTNNASLGPNSPTTFDAGGHNFSINVTTLDFSKFYSKIGKGFNLAFGAEYRKENFGIFAGEEGSYATYDTQGKTITNPNTQTPYVNEFGQQAPGGSQGFPGYSPENAVDADRNNIALYTDAEYNFTHDLLLAGALRFEKFSDFGNTFNYKLATRYKISDAFSFRASTSSGFRAPSLAQLYYNLLFNNIVAGESLLTLLSANNSPVTKAFGIQQLKQETASNYAAGFTYTKSGLSATIDGYMINVDDRIILTDIFDASSLNVGAQAAQFFANGANTKTSGIDVVLNYKKFIDTEGKRAWNAGIAANFNKTKIDKINAGNLNEFTFFGPFSRAYLQAAAPDYKIGLNVGYTFNKFDIGINWTQFSKVELQDFQWVDSPATNQAEADALYAKATDVYKSAGTLDLNFGYKIKENILISIGANNLLNVYPTPQFDGWTDQGGFNDSVQMGSDGTYVFGRIGFKL